MTAAHAAAVEALTSPLTPGGDPAMDRETAEQVAATVLAAAAPHLGAPDRAPRPQAVTLCWACGMEACADGVVMCHDAPGAGTYAVVRYSGGDREG